jgi:hypothetical protein
MSIQNLRTGASLFDAASIVAFVVMSMTFVTAFATLATAA